MNNVTNNWTSVNDVTTRMSSQAGDWTQDNDVTPTTTQADVTRKTDDAIYNTLVVCIPVVVLAGTVGNVLTVAVMVRMKRMKEGVGMANYFIALAVSDLLVLWDIFTVDWVASVSGFNLVVVHDVLCKGINTLREAAFQTSSWLLVAMTCHRMVAVVWPHSQAALRCQSSYASPVVVAAVVASACLYHFPLLFAHSTHTDPVTNETVCDTANGPAKLRHYVDYTKPILDEILDGPASSVFLIVCNAILLRQVYASRKFTKHSTSSVTSRKGRTTSMTVTVVLTSLTFVLLTSPETCGVIYHQIKGTDQRDSTSHHVEEIVFVLWLCNNAINFYIYCLTGSKFRSHLKGLFCQRRHAVT